MARIADTLMICLRQDQESQSGHLGTNRRLHLSPESGKEGITLHRKTFAITIGSLDDAITSSTAHLDTRQTSTHDLESLLRRGDQGIPKMLRTQPWSFSRWTT
jgi:hypothetical protein